MSSSMQPPETEPTTCPSSLTASSAPGGRGELPQVFTTVTSSTRRPASSHSALLRSTSRSTLSMAFRVRTVQRSWDRARVASVRAKPILPPPRPPVDRHRDDDRDREREPPAQRARRRDLCGHQGLLLLPGTELRREAREKI